MSSVCRCQDVWARFRLSGVILSLAAAALNAGPLDAHDKSILLEIDMKMLSKAERSRSGQTKVLYDGQQFEVQTPNIDLFVIGTEFSVIYDPKKDQTFIAVYKGQVEVKTKTEQKAIVSPNGDKPGIVMITQKLSVIKLFAAALILAVVIGGAVFFIRRKRIVRNKKTR